jgi:Uma2 family endonuclease
MALPQEKLYYTPEQYLKFERAALERHEYMDGHIYTMSGESLSHSRICVNLNREMSTQLRGRPCEALSPNMKVKTQASGLFSYPDLSVVCGEPVFHDRYRDVLLNPQVIFEVLSPSTENYDRGAKFIRYRAYLDSLTDYVLLAQDRPFIEHYARQADGRWLMTTVSGLDSVLALPDISCELRLSDIYERVEFPPQDEDDL